MKLATLCYVEKDGQYLMLHRTKKENDMHENLWVGLGGKFEPGESPEDCVIREVYEESGLLIQNPILKGIMTFPSFDQEDWYVFLFLATDFIGDIIPSNEGELAWIDRDQLCNLPMHEGDRYFLKWIEECANVFTAKFIYESGTLKDYLFKMY